MSGGRRTLPWDWYPGEIPRNVYVDETAYVETTFSFSLYRSERDPGVCIGQGASTYLGTMFDVGPKGRVMLGKWGLVDRAGVVRWAHVEDTPGQRRENAEILAEIRRLG